MPFRNIGLFRVFLKPSVAPNTLLLANFSCLNLAIEG